MTIQYFQPEVWSRLILANLHNSLVYAALCNRDYEGDISAVGDTVHITSFTQPSIRAYTKDNDITYDVLTDATRALTIDQGDYYAFTVDDIDRKQALPGFVASASAEAAQALAAEVDDFVSALMYAGVNGQTNDAGGVTADISDNTAYANVFLALKELLDKSNCPKANRWVVIPPELSTAILQDARFIKVNESGTSSGLREGQLGRIAGFDVFESNAVPEPTSGVYSVLAGHPMAMTYADQITETEAVRLIDQFGDGVRGLHVYGGKVIRTACLAVADVTVQA